MSIKEVGGNLPDTEETMPLLLVTPIAATTVRNLLEQRGLQDYVLRVAVADGGCFGMQYHMAFEEKPQGTDTVVETDGIRLVVDPQSRDYLKGATIDFTEDLMGGGFRIENPNIVKSCGCGSSFQTKDSRGRKTSSGCGSCS
jgi:iron-sulfur cluster assembly protein